MALKTIQLPFMEIDIDVALTKVQSLDELPDFVLPYNAKIAPTGTSGTKDTSDVSGSLSFTFRNIDNDKIQDTLPRVRGVTDVAMSKNGAAFRLTQESLIYTLFSDEMSKLIRDAIKPSPATRVPVLDITPLTNIVRSRTSRGAKQQTLMEQLWEVVRQKSLTFEDLVRFSPIDDHHEGSVSLNLGGRVLLFSRSQQLAPFPDTSSRFNGTMHVCGTLQNFTITRPMNPSVFASYVDREMLQAAYLTRKTKLEETGLGRAMQLPDRLEFTIVPTDDESVGISEMVITPPDASTAEFANLSKSKIPRKWCGMERTKDQMKNLRNDSFQEIIRNLEIMTREEFLATYGLSEPEKKAIQLAAETGKMVMLPPHSVAGIAYDIAVINTDGKAGIEKYLIWSDGN